MTDLDAIFADADALSILLGHDPVEAQAWWQGADLAGITPGTVQDLLAARRTLVGHSVVRDELEIGVAAISAFLVPIASSLAEIDAIHDDIARWLAPRLDHGFRARIIGRACAALEILDDPEADASDREDCVDALQRICIDFTFERTVASVNVVVNQAGEHRVMIVAAPIDDEEECVEIGNMPFSIDDGDGRSDRSVTPVAPVPLNA